MEIFLAYNLWLYRSFWLVLCENCSICRCIVDVFVRGRVSLIVYSANLIHSQSLVCFSCAFGSCHPREEISCDSRANGIQKKSSFKFSTEYQVLVDSRVATKVQVLGTTGCISSVVSLIALRPCTIQYSLLGFFIGRMEASLVAQMVKNLPVIEET